MNNLWGTTYPVRTVVAIAAIVLGIGNASAGWIFIADPNSADTATNVGYPDNQGPGTVAAYVKDLLDLPNTPALITSNDHYAGAPLTGLGNPGASSMYVLSFHFGSGNSFWPHTGPFTVFYGCTTGCDSFALPNTQAVSNYRLYDPPALAATIAANPELAILQVIPEPATLAMVGIGIIALASSLRRKTASTVG